MKIGMPTFTQFKQLIEAAGRAGKNMVPIWIEITEDNMTPVLAHMTLSREGVPSFLYESVIGGERTARYSFMGFNPFATFTYKNGVSQIVNQGGDINLPSEKDPRKVLAIEFSKFSLFTVSGLPYFSGGMVGNFGYDTIRLTEPTVPDSNPDELGLPDINLMFFDVVIAFDHVAKKIYLIKLVSVDEADIIWAYSDAMSELEELHQQLLRPRFIDLEPGEPINGAKSNMTKAEFEDMVGRCKEYIAQGDAFQIVVSQRFSCPLTTDPFTVYRCLRHKNPAPFLFFLDFGDWQMVGSSPEILVNVKGGEITICPIAGTRPRGKTTEEDDALAAELLADPKELAEHAMLVDLARNDVARMAEPGSVHIPEGRLGYIVRYSTVMHMVTEVVGRLKKGISPIDALLAGLPAGTLSGAPKIRTMQIIDELESTRRGPYGGAVGFFGFDGNVETAIVIRTAVIVNGMVYWQAGGGIVYDSVPKTEYEESCHKAASIQRALVMAGIVMEGA